MKIFIQTINLGTANISKYKKFQSANVEKYKKNLRKVSALNINIYSRIYRKQVCVV